MDRPETGSNVQIQFFEEPSPRPEASNLLVIGPDSADDMLTAVGNGAAGYVPISRSIETVVQAVLDVSRNQAVIPDTMLGALIREVVRSRRENTTDEAQLEVLTGREREVFALAAKGLDKFAIGQRLGISPATSRTHLANIMAKLDARSRAELVARAAAMGIDTTPEER